MLQQPAPRGSPTSERSSSWSSGTWPGPASARTGPACLFVWWPAKKKMEKNNNFLFPKAHILSSELHGPTCYQHLWYGVKMKPWKTPEHIMPPAPFGRQKHNKSRDYMYIQNWTSLKSELSTKNPQSSCFNHMHVHVHFLYHPYFRRFSSSL